MRRTLLVIAFFMAAAARAQAPRKEAIKQLKNHGLLIYREEDRTYANLRVATPEALKAFDLLRFIKNVNHVNLVIGDAKLAKGSIDALKHTPNIRSPEIRANNGLAEVDFEAIARLGTLEAFTCVAMNLRPNNCER